MPVCFVRLTNDLACSVAYDLPLRPNEAHIFYGNMSKVVVSLMGSTKSIACEETVHVQPPSARRASETNRYQYRF